jgi:anti-sigma B factor antagonist
MPDTPAPCPGDTGVDLALTNFSEGDRTVVQVRGEIDVFTAPDLRGYLVELVGFGHRHLIIDMEHVEFIDSTGLSVLVNVLKLVRTYDGSVRLVCTHERIIRLFRITVLPKAFPIHDTVAEAVVARD